MTTNRLGWWMAGLLLVCSVYLQAQSFGRNKPVYESFDFKVFQSPHFEIYHYLENEEALRQLANQTEQWYQMHQTVLQDTFYSKNPLILYNDHADFQQTNTIMGAIGVGTGGVTEAFKNRVIFPLAMSNQQTHHVLGHELVHAFQYNIVINGDSTNLRNLAYLPLWMVEGLAEYLSIGGVDPFTAMWMRDAVLNDDVPSLDDLNNPKYFPYRYGHAFWAFLTGLEGDEIIAPFFSATAQFGLEQACVWVLGMSKDNLSSLWVSTIRNHFGNYTGDKKERFVGDKLISAENAGRLNIGPQISPDGRYVIFLSEKDLFTIDLFLAEVNSGKILNKVASTVKDGHIDDFNYIESAGTWSANSREFAFVGVSKGKNILIIKEALTGKTVRETELKGVPSFTNPAWSPDGRTIVVSGLVNGQIDLYAYDLRSEKITQLTDDPYTEMHPYWTADGGSLVFSTDELSMEKGRTNGKWVFNLAVMDMNTRFTEQINVFPGADNLNPITDQDGNIIFLSNRDGFRNLYKYEISTGKVYQMTDMITGISGITQYAPAISISQRRDRVLYSHYLKNGYTIYKAKQEEFLNKEVDPYAVDLEPGKLPRVNRKIESVVDEQLNSLDRMSTLPPTAFNYVDYKSRFRLDYIGGSAGVGVGTSNTFGTTSGLAGGVDMLFSDILGNNQLFTSLSLNGEIQDFGGALAYINRKSRVNWGASLSHIPFRTTGLVGRFIDTLQVSGGGLLTDHWQILVRRIFEDRVSLFAQLPFTTTMRLQAEASFARYSESWTLFDNYYDFSGFLIAQERSRQDAPPGFNLWTVNTHLVGDNSFFGLTAPLQGYRYRFGVEQYFGEFNFSGITADFRKYWFSKPLGFAVRLWHYGRYGTESDQLFPIYVGNPWFIRGFNANRTEEIFVQNGESLDQLLGSKIMVANFEVRIPFTGPEQLTLFKSGFLFSDLNFFVDGGMAWYEFDQFDGDVYFLDESGQPVVDRDGDPVIEYFKARPYFSAGTSLRVNLFGALILEPYYAVPLVKNTKGVFGLNIIPGW